MFSMKKIIKTVNEFNDAKERLSIKNLLACDIEATDLDYKKAKIQGVGIGDKDEQFYFSFDILPLDELKNLFNSLFTETEIIFHNAKYDMQILHKYGIEYPKNVHDTMLMSWLVNENSRHGLKFLAKEILDRKATNFSEVNQTIDLFTTEEDILRDLGNYCMDDVKNTFDLYEYFEPILKEQGLIKDYSIVETKFVKVLSDMEIRGIQLDIENLREKKNKLGTLLGKLELELNKLAPRINVRSPKQLEEYIYDELGFIPDKVTKSGKRSTDSEAFEGLIKKHSLGEDHFISKLLFFRDLDKVYNTYFVGLDERCDNEGVVRPSFLQHGTRTGRLSSRDPNAQNISTRHDEWDVRKLFIPREGYTFIVSDYSQIELRMLAHFSKDEHMVNTFLEDGDIHAKTMQLTGTERRAAKAINFGLVYGMGSMSLAKTLDISEAEAAEYIERFFAGYPKVRSFIKATQNQALRFGYVTMITGRRRRFNEMIEQKFFSSVKRQAVNTKIQGSAADLIKIAMIKLNKNLKTFNAHQILQVHDEIVVECPTEHLDEVKDVVKETMEGALQLIVPLKVGMALGDHWIKD